MKEAMDTKESVSFKQHKGYFVPRWALILAIAVALAGLLVVGLLAGLLSPCGSDQPDTVRRPERPKPLPYVRLPRSVVPEHYDVELQPYLEPGNFTFDGRVRIVIRVLEATDNVTLHVHNMTVREAVLEGPAGAPSVSGTSVDEEKQFYVLHLDRALVSGSRYEVRMRFLGHLNDNLAGFYRSSYKDEEGKTRWLATTQFQPTDARRAFPCFDEPALKATFNITLVRRAEMVSLSNMPLNYAEIRGFLEDWVADHYIQTVKMSTYLLAFIVSDFKMKGNKEFGVWSREAVVNTTQYALETGPAILKFYETFFQVPYPLPKTDMVAIPDFSAGAMENWGLITYRETALLYDPRYSSASNKQRVATVISHELAHQWFGNLVTPSWWDDLWLNEGFASYVEYLGVQAVHPDWKMDEQFVLDDLHDVLELDSLRSSHPISLPVRHPDEINEIFDRISYGKGASLIRMMKYFLGDKNFKNGLMNYLNAKKFDNAVQDDLWKHLTDVQTDNANRINVKDVMDSWTLQTGYPVVMVKREGTTATVTQYRFLLEGDNGTDTTAWEVPFTYTDELNPNWEPETKLWLHRKNGTISGLPERYYWIIANVQQVGYYRVNYDSHNWVSLIVQLHRDHKKIHTVNRAQIIDDALDLARAGQLSYDIALNTTTYLSKEEEYLPWKSAMHGFSFIDSMICRSAIYGIWKTFLIEMLRPTYESLGWEERPDENILEQYKRSSTLGWMCKYGYEDCIEKAKQKFSQWQADPNNTNIIPPNLRSVVYCTGISQGGEKAWDFVWQRYKSAEIASEKDKFMYALACAKEPWLLTRYLNWSLTADSGIRRQDGSYVFRSMGSKLHGRDLTFNYIRDKWDAIFARYGKSFFAVSSLVKSVTSSLNTAFELSQLRDFYEKHKGNLGTAKRAFEQSLEGAAANVRWMDSNYPQVSHWLTEQWPKSPRYF